MTEAPVQNTESTQLGAARRRVQLPSWMFDLFVGAKEFLSDNAMGMAGMVAFFAFLSIIPLLILLLTFLGDVFAGRVPPHDVRNLFHDVMPGLSQQQFLDTYWNPVRHSRVATRVLGVVSLLLGTMGLHDSIDWAVNRIWESPRQRSFWVAKARGIAVILWVIIFSLLSLWLGWLWAGALGAVHADALGGIGVGALLPSLVLDVVVFTALYKLTPTVIVCVPAAVTGAIAAAVLWEASKVAFGWWVVEVGSYNRVYGPLAASVIVMLWLWVSAMIFLYGAEVSAAAQRRLAVAESAQVGAPNSV